MFAVAATAAAGTTPIPLGFGQISLLISFICHAWWPAPSVGPFFSTMLTHAAWWSRQELQAWDDPFRNLTSVSGLVGFESHFCVVKRLSSSIPVPTSAILNTFRSDRL